ncbi:sugar ABC transporter ATP-binding protein [Paeniglutamicibacter antarcticus]|uniref:Sugar ABC transporter ATP-binding protein n=2 Tax=Paeniglutamicibacter antarcticus TaxID=494023 RepID=A0ABP9TN85_9MICC
MSIALGEVSALLGENGAGKSTLAKILAGSLQPDKGNLSLDGQPTVFSSPREAIDSGIAFIPQELIYVPDLSVAENICLGNLREKKLIVSQAAIYKKAESISRRFGIDVPLSKRMRDVSLASQQKIEILKALGRESKVLILDEPTAALTNDESAELLHLVAELAATGMSIIYISHRLDEIKKSCETAHILRDGLLVASHNVATTDTRVMVEDMLGRKLEARSNDRTPTDHSEPALQTHALTSPAGVDRLNGIDLCVGRNEVVTVYGRRGSGIDKLARSMAGLEKDVAGDIQLFDSHMEVFKNPGSAIKAGVAYVPAERKSQGLLMKANISRNITHLVWPSMAKFFTIRRRDERKRASKAIEAYRIKCRSGSQSITDLSGGNQQKVMIASRMEKKPRFAVMHEPTRGVDVGSRQEIHGQLERIARGGVPVLIFTSDIEEACTAGDRLLVINDGKIVHEIVYPTISDQTIALHIAGAGTTTNEN